MIYKLNKNIFAIFIMFLGLVSCYDTGYEEFVPPSGNINNIQPNTLFTTSTSADDTMSFVFRSYSTDAVSYSWDFGDGNTSTEANLDYTYEKGGLYNVKLTTISSDGLKAVDSSNVAPIFVDFNTTQIDSEVTFENLVTGASSLVWDFGDGETVEWKAEDTEEDPNFSPVHTYKTADTFTATLKAVTYLNVEVSISKKIEGLILSTVPDFTFAASGFTVQFTDDSVLAVSHSWDFGDGNTSTEVNPIHTFPGEGTYDVTLTTTNEAGVSKSITKPVPVGAQQATFAAEVLNSTCNDWTKNTGDNADAWDMTPGSTIEDNDGNTIDSPYRAIWNNTELNAYIDATYCTSEQPGSSSDGNKFGPLAGGGRGVKLSNSCRRLYQVVAVEPGVEYTFTIDTRSEAETTNPEVFILNTEITTEDNIQDYADGYLQITNDYNKDKSSSTKDTFTTSTFTFTASSNIAVIYVRALNAVDSSNEVFIDNIDILTPGFNPDGTPTGAVATFAAVIQNGSIDEFKTADGYHKDDNNDAWETDPPGTFKNGQDSPYTWDNTGLRDVLGLKAAGITTSEHTGEYALKFSGAERRAYQPFAVEFGVEYTVKMWVRTETGDDFNVYILNNEVQDESDLAGNSDTVYTVSGNPDSYVEHTFTFKASSTTAVFYGVPFAGVDGSSEVYLDDISIETPGF